jgi:hypothetical protein
MQRMMAGTLREVVVSGAVSPSICLDAVSTLRGMRAREHPDYPFRTYGQVLLTSSDEGDYLAAARELEKALPKALLGALTRGLRGLAPGLGLKVPKTADGQFYAAVTARVLPDGADIAVHSERCDWDAMAHLTTLADLGQQLSFYLVLQAPAAGGELLLYEGHSLDNPQVIPLQTGDLVVFDGTRHNHRVTPVEGDTERWTLGGFLTVSGQTVLFWS